MVYTYFQVSSIGDADPGGEIAERLFNVMIDKP